MIRELTKPKEPKNPKEPKKTEEPQNLRSPRNLHPVWQGGATGVSAFPHHAPLQDRAPTILLGCQRYRKHSDSNNSQDRNNNPDDDHSNSNPAPMLQVLEGMILHDCCTKEETISTTRDWKDEVRFGGRLQALRCNMMGTKSE